jgi:hypothetical protein
MRPPSTAWREQIAPDETQRFQGYAEEIVEIQRRKSQQFGPGRALHRRQLVGLRAHLEVLPELPPHARHGLFARPRRLEALVRLSSGSMNRQADRMPDIRGFAIKVLGVEGPGALGGPTSSQDFVLINHEAFSTARSDGFTALVRALSHGPLALVAHLLRGHGPIEGVRRLKRALAFQNRPFSGFASEAFHSAAPLACGPYAVRVRLGQARPQGLPAASRDWASDLRRHLAQGPLVHPLQLQFYVDEAVTPIEDASVVWPESEAPYVTVGRLTIPTQELDGEEARRLTEQVEAAAFDPWKALVEHRPLGDVMRARKHAYFASQKARGAAS